MTTLDQISRAISWAAHELGYSKLICTNVTILPWSATARLQAGEQQYWVKVSPTSNHATEWAILTVAQELSLPALPVRVGSSQDLGALLMEHVPSDLKPLCSAEVMAARDETCAALTERKTDLHFAALSAIGCSEDISASCQTDRTWWIDSSGSQTLMAALEKCNQQLADIDEFLGSGREVVHGDLHPGNIISSPRGLVFLDWADAAWGAPAWDLAIYAASSGGREGLDNKCVDLVDVLAGLKEVADFLRTPLPVAGETYSLSIPHLRQHISRRVIALCQSIDSLRLNSLN